MFIYISPRAFFACFPAPCGFLFYRSWVDSLWCSRALLLLRVPFSSVFPCSYHHSLRSFLVVVLPVGAGVPCFRCFPFVPFPVVACRWAMRCRFSPVSVSFFVSSGGEKMLVSVMRVAVAWRCRDGGVVLPFCLAARFLPCRGSGAFLSGFPYGIIGGGRAVRLRRNEHSE